MKQNDSKYHLLYLSLKDAEDWFPKENRSELLDIIKELYVEHERFIEEKDDKGKYGIRYKTVEEDSRYADTHIQFFSTKERRNNVYEDWLKERYWDTIFDTELQYRTPSPNVHNIEKIFKEGGEIYIEKT